jgi:FkbM family methyltransferase
MGHLRDKYTSTYFTRRDSEGNMVEYGAAGYEAFLRGEMREQDLLVLSQLSFAGKRVLEFGYGRGEAIKFAIEHGAQLYEGVDFSDAARPIAQSFLSGHGITARRLQTVGALDFLRDQVEQNGRDKGQRFDIVLMLDFAEHVAPYELRELLGQLPTVIAPRCVIVVNTTAFGHDKDIIAHGMDARSPDTSDPHEATAGMRCNQYSVPSLQGLMRGCGYRNISEAHFFVPEEMQTPHWPRRSYRVEWERAHEMGYPIIPTYKDDTAEYATAPLDSPRWQTFDEGMLEGIQLLATDEYRACAFPEGDYDRVLFNDCQTVGIEGKVVFDVGGFMGVSSLLFSRMVGPEGRVFSFEPNPWNQIRMQRNFSRNHDLGQKINIYGLALADSPGDLAWTFSGSVDDGHSSTSRLGKAHATIASAELRQLGFIDDLVRATTLDEFVEEYGVVPDVVKVDIEGAEHLLLMGGASTLKQHNPTLYVEIHSPFCGLLCSDLLHDLGYLMDPLLEESDGRLLVKASKTPKQASESRSSPSWLTLSAAAHRPETGSPRQENRVLREQLAQTSDQLSQTQEELAKARQRFSQAELELAAHAALLLDVRRSTSWRVSAPLRLVGRVMRCARTK